jgi:protein phosphatase
LQAYGKSDRGCVRKDNEDRILIDDSSGVFVVCDGMGGHQHGELAAELAISAIKYFITNSSDRFDLSWPFGYTYELSLDANRLVTSIRLANRQVWRKAEQSLENTGMGTTVTAALFNGDQCVIGNVGDTRAYLLRSGSLQQLSTDDTMLATMLQRGALSPAQAAVHPMRSVLTQAAGSQETLDVHVWEGAVIQGDKLLLCTDGLYSVVDEPTIRATLSEATDVETTLNRLVTCALEKGAPDNVSGVLIYR